MHATKPGIAGLALLLALGAAGSAPATMYRDTSAGGACQPASGAASASFSHSNNYVTNLGTTAQYVICHFAMDDAVYTPSATELLVVHVQSTQAATRTVACSAQAGSFYNGTNQVYSAQLRSYTFSHADDAYLEFDHAAIVRGSPWHTFTLNCRMDPGTRVGLIEYRTS
jgi:hypothetical protein